MTLPKLLVSALTGSLSIIALLVGSWMHSISTHQETLDTRISAAEANYATIQAELKDLKENVRDIKTFLIKR